MNFRYSNYCFRPKKIILHFEDTPEMRVEKSLFGFLSKSVIFCKQKSDLLVKKRELLTLLFYHERREQIAQGHFFVKSKARPKIQTRDGQI